MTITEESNNPNENPKKDSEEEEEEDDSDRISELPEELLLKILSFLRTTEVIKTSLLSTRWKNLWKSHRFIRLYHSRPNKFINQFGGIMNFIDYVLRLRDSNSSTLEKFSLYCTVQCNVDLLDQCIVTAVNQGVQVIDIILRNLPFVTSRGTPVLYGSITLKPCLFNSGVVSTFKFSVIVTRFRIRLPLSICIAKNLRFLNLRGIVLPQGNSKGELPLICPILKELIIRDCGHKHLRVLDISAPKLEKLWIYNKYESRYSKYLLGECVLKISTSKLKSFKYRGYSYVDYSFMNSFPFLNKVDVNFDGVRGTVEQDKAFLRSIKLLKGFLNAKYVRFDRFERFSWVPDTIRKQLSLKPFTRLQDLKLRSTPTIASIQGMVYLLWINSSNLLEKFVWEVRKGDFVKEAEEVEHEELVFPKCTLCHLKLVRIRGLKGLKNELKFLRFLLKSAVVLEEMIHYHCKFKSNNRRTRRRRMPEAKAVHGRATSITVFLSMYQTVNEVPITTESCQL